MILNLNHFSSGEFGDSWDDMSARQLILLDVFRSFWGRRFIISPHPRALSRFLGPDELTQHNVDRWGECRATDGFPEGLTTKNDAQFALIIATRVGFTGIGIYPHWQLNGEQRIGVHLDTRLDRTPGNPATWGGVMRNGTQQFVSIDEAISLIGGQP